jgi:hypothetical protein
VTAKYFRPHFLSRSKFAITGRLEGLALSFTAGWIEALHQREAGSVARRAARVEPAKAPVEIEGQDAEKIGTKHAEQAIDHLLGRATEGAGKAHDLVPIAFLDLRAG